MSDFFRSRPSDICPTIYGYTEAQYPGMIKVGYTDRKDYESRIREQYPTLKPGKSLPYQILFAYSAMRADGSIISDKKVHQMLERMGCRNVRGEWYKCTERDIQKALKALKDYKTEATERTENFSMRPEQKEAVEKTMAYFESFKSEVDSEARIPKFLWNCKMRFGKTFTSYQLAKAMNFKRVLILTFKPAVKTAWKEDLLTHVDFDGWSFISQPAQGEQLNPPIDKQYEDADKSKPIVCFGSFQDLLGVDKDTGTIKARNEFIHLEDWDLVIFDEYHFGAWREKAKQLFEQEDEEKLVEGVPDNYDQDDVYDESFLPIHTSHYLFLSGTPFRALNSGEFIEEQIYTWTYSDEQSRKENWDDSMGKNPYRSLPRMVMLTYKVPESIRKVAMQGEFNEFDLNIFFEAKGTKDNAVFVLKDYVQKWLDLIRGSYLETSIDDLKVGRKPPFPFANGKLLTVLNHTLWYLPSVASCYAMRNLMKERQNAFYHDYEVVVCAGNEAGQGSEALKPVEYKMDDPLKSRTITLSCGKLTTGVTVKPWTGVFMLRNLSQPESYFQTAFRVQSPWTIKDASGNETILKEECYVFDFALNRTLRQVAEYSNRLNTKDRDPEKKVRDFIKFLPVLAYNGINMYQIDAGEILDIAMSGTSATLLARRWESALLVNVDNATLQKILNNPEALAALRSIEGFRNINQTIETIINKSESVKEAKREGKDKTGSEKEKKQLSDEEKEFKSKRKEIQEKLVKFATRIPIFMYLTDFREACLHDVITQLEPELFNRVTGLKVKDFELLASIGVFNEALMNDAIFKFRRYENASLEYTGINKHKEEKNVGGYNTIASKDNLNNIYGEEVQFDNSIVEGDVLYFKGKKAVVDKRKGDKIWVRVDGRRLDPIVLSVALAAGSLSKTKPEEPALIEEAASPDKTPYSEQPSHKETKKKSGFHVSVAPNAGYGANVVFVGDKVRTDNYGICTVTEIRGGKIYMTTTKGKIVTYYYPSAFDKGVLRKV